MAGVLLIGVAGAGAGSVAAHKMAQCRDVLSHITLASRRRSKCEAITASVKRRTGVTIDAAELDADDVAATTALIEAL